MKKPDKPLPYEMSPFHVFAAFNEPFANAMAQTTSAFAKGLESVQGELAQFTAKRLRHDAETFYRTSRCENYEQFSKIQQEWLSGTAEDYMEEAGRVMGLGQTMLDRMNAAGNTLSEELAEAIPPAIASESLSESVAKPTVAERTESAAAVAAKRAASEGVAQRSKAPVRAAEPSRPTASKAAATELPSGGRTDGDANGSISTDA